MYVSTIWMYLDLFDPLLPFLLLAAVSSFFLGGMDARGIESHVIFQWVTNQSIMNKMYAMCGNCIVETTLAGSLLQMLDLLFYCKLVLKGCQYLEEMFFCVQRWLLVTLDNQLQREKIK